MQVDNEGLVSTPAPDHSSWPVSSSCNVLKFLRFIIELSQLWKEYHPKVSYSLLSFIFLTTHYQLHQYAYPCSITELACQSELTFFLNRIPSIYHSL